MLRIKPWAAVAQNVNSAYCASRQLTTIKERLLNGKILKVLENTFFEFQTVGKQFIWPNRATLSAATNFENSARINKKEEKEKKGNKRKGKKCSRQKFKQKFSVRRQ